MCHGDDGRTMRCLLSRAMASASFIDAVETARRPTAETGARALPSGGVRGHSRRATPRESEPAATRSDRVGRRTSDRGREALDSSRGHGCTLDAGRTTPGARPDGADLSATARVRACEALNTGARMVRTGTATSRGKRGTLVDTRLRIRTAPCACACRRSSRRQRTP